MMNSFTKNSFLMMRKLISVILVIGMIIGLIPENAYAKGFISYKNESSSNEVKFEDDGCIFWYKENSTWSNYVSVEVTIQNKSDRDRSLWSVDMDYSGHIDNIWNADVVASDNARITVSAKTYNTNIPAGQSVSFGFIAYGDKTKPEAPSKISFHVDKNDNQNDSESDNSSSSNTSSDDNNNSSLEGSTYSMPSDFKALEYALFTSGKSDISLHTYKTLINGSVHTNQNFFYQGTTLEINGVLEAAKGINLNTSSMKNALQVQSKKEKAEVIDIPDITNEIRENASETGTTYKKDEFFGSDSIVIEKPILVEGNANFNSTTFLGKGIIYASKSITYNAGTISTPQNSRVLLVSERGDITLNGSTINLNSTIYAPNGTVNINANEFHLNGRIIAKAVNINGSIIEINAGPSDFEMIDFVFTPEISLSTSGTYKQNRKVSFEVSNKDGSKPGVDSDITWTITKDGADASALFATTADITNASVINGIFKESGTYTVTASLKANGNVVTESEEVTIIPDTAPSAAFVLDDNKYFRGSDGKAVINITDASASPDGDEISKRTWTVFYDKNNNGIYEADEAEIISDKNETSVSYTTKNVGKYKVVLSVQESFTDTIPELLTDEDYLSDSTDESDTDLNSGVFEVDNAAPQSGLEIEKTRQADIVFTVGDADKEKLAIYNSKASELKSLLESKGVDVKVDTMSSKVYTAQDNFAWKEYSHYDFDDYPNHIVYDGPNIRMLGYYEAPAVDFLYIDDKNPGQKIFEYDIQRDDTDWHSMVGGGFLFNADVSEEGDYIRGYYVLLTEDGLRLFQLECEHLELFRTGYYGKDEILDLLAEYPLDDVYADHHIRIVVDEKTISLWCDGELTIDDFVLPDQVYGNGFGPITRHGYHWCEQRSFFTFRNIKMETQGGSGLSDIIDGYNWRPAADHYVINLSDEEVPELSDNETKADLAAAIIKNDAYFIGLGNDKNEDQYHSLMGLTEGSGLTLNNDNLSEKMDEVNSFIEKTVAAKDTLVSDSITTDEIIGYRNTYSDKENDPKYKELWEYEYIPGSFDTSALSSVNTENTQNNSDNTASTADIIDKESVTADPLNSQTTADQDKATPTDANPIVATSTDATPKTDNNGDISNKDNNTSIETGTVTLPNGHILRREEKPLISFETIGAYAIRSRVQDDPTYGNEDIASYRRWSDSNDLQRLLVVQSRPVCDIQADITKDDSSDGNALVNVIYTAENPDHKEEAGRGIAQERYLYKEAGDSSWTEGRFPNRIEIGKTYIIKYQVMDTEGTWSYPATKVIKTNDLREFVQVEDNVPPTVYINASKTLASVGDLIEVEAYAEDDHGVKEFSVYIDDENVMNYYGRTFIVPDKAGTIKVRATATDLGGNTSEKEVEITVAGDRDVTLPVADIISPAPGAELGEEIEFIGTAKDETKLKSYILSYKKDTDTDYTQFAEGTETVENGLLGKLDITNFKEGLYDIRLLVTDAADNYSVVDMEIYVQEGKTVYYNISGEITDLILNKEEEQIEIKGSVNAEGHLARYELVYQAENSEESIKISEGTEEVKDTLLGTISTKTLKTGKYDVYLYVEDVNGKRVRFDASFDYKEDSESGNGENNENGENNGENNNNENGEKFSLSLSYSRASVGTPVTAQVTLANGMNQEHLKIYKDDKLLSENELTAEFTSENAGRVSIKAVYTLDEKEKEVNPGRDEIVLNAECTFFNGEDKTSPVIDADLSVLEDILKTPVDITGSVSDETGLDFWRLEYRLKPYAEYTVIAEGTEDIKDGKLGTVDPTLMMNGEYELRILVQDKGGNISKLTKDFIVEGDLKIGNYHIGFTDVTASMCGTTVNVNRIYDTRNKNKGDFGYGWTMDLSGMRLTESHSLSDGYEMTKSGSVFSTTYRLQETVSHDVVVAYGDGTSDRFSLVINNGISVLTPISEVSFGYKCVTDQKAKLEILADTTALYEGGQLVFLDESIYNSPDYKLTTAEGNEIYINKTRGVYKITDASGHVITVDKNGYHSEDGKSIEFTRDSEERITEIKDPLGNVTKYTYDANGDLIAVIDSADRTVSYTYDNKHNLITITDPMGIAVSRNEYDDDGRLVATIDADGNRMEFSHDIDGRQEVIKDRRGNSTVYVYDDNGNVLKTTDALGNITENTYDEFNNCTSTTVANGHTTTYAYDASGNVTKVTAADGTAVESTYSEENYVTGIKMLDKNVMAMTYANNGALTSVSDANGNRTEYEYSTDGKLTGMTDAIGVYQKMTYDSEGNVVSTTNGAGESAYYTYDDQNRCSSVTIKRTEDGKEISFTSRYTYDDADNITQSVDNAGNVTTYEYDANGNQIASVDSKNRRISYEYDHQANLVKTIYPDGTSESFEYDANGNNISATDRSGLKVTMEYDKLDRMISKIYADGNKETYAYDAVGNVIEQVSVTGAKTTYVYDERDRNTSITDAFGNTTKFTYDAQSKLTSRIDAKDNTTSYEYDNNGNISKTTYPDGNSVTSEYDARNRVTAQTDQNGNTTSYEYDGADKLTKVTDADGNSYEYAYDANGNLIKVTDALGHSTEYTYDAVGHVNSLKNAAGKTALYEYDSTGKVTKETDFAGHKTEYYYDDMDRVISKKTADNDVTYIYTEDGLLSSVKDNSGTVSYKYDKLNRLTSYTDAQNITVSYTYDKLGNIESIDNGYNKTKYEYDILNRLTRVIDHNGNATVYEYDELGNRSAVRYPNGNVMSYTYDACQRLREEVITDASGKQIAKYSYGLGKAGERLTVTEEESSVESGSANTSKEIKTEIEYSYDKLNRLVKEVISREDTKLTQEYTYDKVSNRLSKKITVSGDIAVLADIDLEEVDVKTGTTSYTYNELNQLVSEKNGSDTTTYTYDDNGNLVKEQGRKIKDYTYDSENHLMSATVQQGNSVTVEEYTYDYAGNRTSKAVNEVDVTGYINDIYGDLTYVLGETDKDGKLKKSYTRGQELISAETVAQNGNTTGDIYYFFYDGHGSTRVLTDKDGNVTDRYSYDGYGILLEKEGDTENDFLYTGEQYNYTTELYYLRARYMDPSTGTFISMDSYAGSLSDPITLHKYLYANANPVMNTDPSGYSPIANFVASINIQGILLDAYATAAITNLGMKILAQANAQMSITKTLSISQETVLSIGMDMDNSDSINDISYEMLYNTLDTIEFAYTIANDCAALEVIENETQIVKKWVEDNCVKVDKEKEYEGNSVYVLKDPKNNYRVSYVGISNDPWTRYQSHMRAGNKSTNGTDWIMYVVKSGLNRKEARLLENALICVYTMDALANARHEIAKKNFGKFSDEMDRVATLTGVSTETLENMMLKDY